MHCRTWEAVRPPDERIRALHGSLPWRPRAEVLANQGEDRDAVLPTAAGGYWQEGNRLLRARAQPGRRRFAGGHAGGESRSPTSLLARPERKRQLFARRLGGADAMFKSITLRIGDHAPVICQA